MVTFLHSDPDRLATSECKIDPECVNENTSRGEKFIVVHRASVTYGKGKDLTDLLKCSGNLVFSGVYLEKRY